MTIKRDDLDLRAVDFSEVASGWLLPPIHPGEILRDEFLVPLGLSVYRLARALKISRPRLNDIVLGRRGVTIDTALRLGRYFGTTPELWIMRWSDVFRPLVGEIKVDSATTLNYRPQWLYLKAGSSSSRLLSGVVDGR